VKNNGLYILQISLVAALGGFLFGFDTAVISGTTEKLKDLFELSDGGLGFTVAIALIGTIVGALLVGNSTDKFGRKKMLFVMAVLYFVSAIGCAFSWDWISFLVFRFIGGLGVGGASVVSSMYIAEVSPAKGRGKMVALQQFNIVFGILMAYVSNYIITLQHLGGIEWRLMFGIEALPAILFFALLFLIPASPRWLVSKGRNAEAKKVIDKLHGSTGGAEAELKAIEHSFESDRHLEKEPLFTAKYLKVMLLAVAITAFNQLSGINAIIYYAPKVFKLTGAGSENAMLQSIIIGIVNLIFTMLALSVIDKMGRKKLMLIGSIGYIVSLATAAGVFMLNGEVFSQAAGFTLLGAITLFIASHAFGQGAVVWVFISEIFPNRVRARGQALGAFSIWVFAALVSQIFPVILGTMGGGITFALFCGFMVIQLVWVITVMPETKGVPLEEIEDKLGIK
jgi:SP family xylose:H+ symportor-like MFS transporter